MDRKFGPLFGGEKRRRKRDFFSEFRATLQCVVRWTILLRIYHRKRDLSDPFGGKGSEDMKKPKASLGENLCRKKGRKKKTQLYLVFFWSFV
jgi:hypothetical protein